VPYEQARQVHRQAQRLIDREMTVIVGALQKQAELSEEKREAAIGRLKLLRERLTGLREETGHYRARCKHRLALLADPASWERVRLTRLVGDLLLREGHLQAARELAEREGISVTRASLTAY